MGKWIDYALGFCILGGSLRLYSSTGNIHYLWLALTLGLFAVHIIFYNRRENNDSNQDTLTESSPQVSSTKQKWGINQMLLIVSLFMMMLSVSVIYISETYQLSPAFAWSTLAVQLVVTCAASGSLLRQRSRSLSQ